MHLVFVGRFVVAGLVAALLLGACSKSEESLPRPSKPFCIAANTYDTRIDATPRPSIAEQITLIENMAAHAPKDIAHDTRVFLDAMRRVRTDPSVKNDPEVKDAVENVNRRASNGCGIFDQQQGTGF